MLELQKPERQPTCPVAETCKTLDPQDQQTLLTAIADKAWPITALTIALRNNGINIPEKRLYAHRNGDCAC